MKPFKGGTAHCFDKVHSRSVPDDGGFNRLTLKQCRRLLAAAGAAISDQDIERLRDELYDLAEVTLEGFRNGEEYRDETFEERAAIIEADGGLDRAEAERLARGERMFKRERKRPLRLQ